MSIIKKHYKKIICALLCLVIGGGFVVTSIINGKNNEISMNVRRIDVNQMSFGEQAEQILNQFHNYETSNTDTTIHFEGDMFASIGEILGFDSLSNQEDEVVKRFATSYDYLTNTFYMNVSYYTGDVLLETISEEAEPQYDEQRDDGYIECDGERFYFSETFDVDALDNCMAAAAPAAAGAASNPVGLVIVAAVVILIIITPPDIKQAIATKVEQVVETVVESVKTFFGWFSKWVTKTFTRTKTVTTTTVVTTKTPTLEIDKTKYSTKAITLDESKKLPKTAYYLAFADVSNGLFYISTISMQHAHAVAVMSVAIATNCMGNSSYQMIASVFTLSESNTYSIMDKVGYASYTSKNNPHFEKGLHHYHSRAEIVIKTPGSSSGERHSPHFFFMNRYY